MTFVPKDPINNIDSDNGFAPMRRQGIVWINDGLIYCCIYASLGLNALNIKLVKRNAYDYGWQSRRLLSDKILNPPNENH